MITPVKTKKCPICGSGFIPRSSLQKVCHDYGCALVYTRQKNQQKQERESRKADALQRENLRIRRENLKTWSEHNRDAQREFNKYIRARDAGRPCASCGCELRDKSHFLTGSAVDASHYRSRGSASHLRFNVFNVVACCTRCNRELSGNVVNLRIGLVNRFGLEAVERLESDNAPRRFGTDYLIRIKLIFSRRAKHITRLRARLSGA